MISSKLCDPSDSQIMSMKGDASNHPQTLMQEFELLSDSMSCIEIEKVVFNYFCDLIPLLLWCLMNGLVLWCNKSSQNFQQVILWNDVLKNIIWLHNKNWINFNFALKIITGLLPEFLYLQYSRITCHAFSKAKVWFI